MTFCANYTLWPSCSGQTLPILSDSHCQRSHALSTLSETMLSLMNMEIRKLNFTSLIKLEELLALQQKAYQIEANILGIQFLPPQQESLQDLQSNKEEIFVMQDALAPI